MEKQMVYVMNRAQQYKLPGQVVWCVVGVGVCVGVGVFTHTKHTPHTRLSTRLSMRTHTPHNLSNCGKHGRHGLAVGSCVTPGLRTQHDLTTTQSHVRGRLQTSQQVLVQVQL